MDSGLMAPLEGMSMATAKHATAPASPQLSMAMAPGGTPARAAPSAFDAAPRMATPYFERHRNRLSAMSSPMPTVACAVA